MMQNISFQGRTNLVFSNAKFNDLLHCKSLERRKCCQGINEFVPQRTIGVDMDGSSVLVFVRNEKDGFIQKFSVGKKVEALLLELEDRVNQLKIDTQENLTAWILGGRVNDSKNTKTINEIAEIICDRPDIDTSILTGDKSYTVDRIFLKGNSQGTEIVFPRHKHLESEDNLESVFEIAELNNTQVSVN